jgi:large-conductance mechanosensitive channel
MARKRSLTIGRFIQALFWITVIGLAIFCIVQDAARSKPTDAGEIRDAVSSEMPPAVPGSTEPGIADAGFGEGTGG